MKLSIIIPVYRVEATLERCIESVLAQDYTDWEMILVDDGSDDSSPSICDSYAEADGRIKVIHQRNLGLGAARNSGILSAKGEYLMFIDSDDYIAANTIGPLVMEMDKSRCDFIEFPYIRHSGSSNSHKVTFTPKTYDNMAAYFFKEKAYCHSYAWNKIYRHEIFAATRFKEGKKFEDMFTLPHILKVCKKTGMTDKGCYHYIDNPQGITITAGRNIADLLEAHTDFLQSIGWKRPKGISRKAFAVYYAHVMNIQISVYELCGSEYLTLHRPHYPITPKLIIAALLGTRTICEIIKQIHKICRTNR